MSTPRYIPRNYLKSHYTFGRALTRGKAWKIPESDEPDPRAQVYATAARIQNDLLAQASKVILKTGTKPSTICRAGHFSLQRWQRIRRGDIVLRLEDLAAIEIATGYTLSLQFTDYSGKGSPTIPEIVEQEDEAVTQRDQISRLSRALQPPHRSSQRG